MNDFDLLNQIKKGNAASYKYLVSKYQRLVFNIIWRLTNDSEIDDIAQDVFIKVYKNIKNYRKESKLSTWIASIAWKTTIDHIRRKSRSKLDFTNQPEIFECAIVNNVAEEARQNDIKEVVNEMLQRLPVQYKSILSLYYLEEFSYAEIQEITDMPLGTIKSYLSRARSVLKEEVEKNYGKEARLLLNNSK